MRACLPAGPRSRTGRRTPRAPPAGPRPGASRRPAGPGAWPRGPPAAASPRSGSRGRAQRRPCRRPARPSSRGRPPWPRPRPWSGPVRISSIARAEPIARVSRCVPPAPGMTPMRISGWPNRASSPATIRSHDIASSQPPPSAKPRTAAISGSSVAQMRSHASNRRSLARRSGVWSASSVMSAPAANARSPDPVSDDRARDAVPVEARELVGQLVEQVEAQGVQRVGALEGDEDDAVVARRGGLDAKVSGRRLEVRQGDLAPAGLVAVQYPRSRNRPTAGSAAVGLERLEDEQRQEARRDLAQVARASPHRFRAPARRRARPGRRSPSRWR